MAMQQIGYVTQASEKEIKIRVMRESACGGNCASCHGCPSGAVLINHPNHSEHPFSVGDAVLITMPTGQFLGGTLRTYGLLTVCMILGAVLGFYLTKMELVSVLGAVLGLIFGTFLMRFISRKYQGAIQVTRHKEGIKR